MTGLHRLQVLRVEATLHALATEPYSEARAIREDRARRIASAYWQARLAEDAAAARRRAAYLRRRGGAA